MKKFLLGLALILSFSVTAAKGADSCPGVGLTNGVGSPPVVTGSTVSYYVSGIAPSVSIFWDGAYAGEIYDWAGTPHGNWFTEFVSASPIPPGSHSLQVGWDSCVVNFTVVPPGTDVTTIPLTSAWGTNGFFGAVYGQTASPATTSNGKTYQSFNETVTCVWGPCGAPYAQVSISGFTSNPGQGWLVSATALGVTKFGNAASFVYAPSTGTASWGWHSLFGFGTSGTTTVAIVHN